MPKRTPAFNSLKSLRGQYVCVVTTLTAMTDEGLAVAITVEGYVVDYDERFLAIREFPSEVMTFVALDQLGTVSVSSPSALTSIPKKEMN